MRSREGRDLAEGRYGNGFCRTAQRIAKEKGVDADAARGCVGRPFADGVQVGARGDGAGHLSHRGDGGGARRHGGGARGGARPGRDLHGHFLGGRDGQVHSGSPQGKRGEPGGASGSVRRVGGHGVQVGARRRVPRDRRPCRACGALRGARLPHLFRHRAGGARHRAPAGEEAQAPFLHVHRGMRAAVRDGDPARSVAPARAFRGQDGLCGDGGRRRLRRRRRRVVLARGAFPQRLRFSRLDGRKRSLSANSAANNLGY